MAAATLISPKCLALQQQLHAAPRGYGGKGRKWAAAVHWLARRFGTQSVLDYGCGQGSLMKELAFQYGLLDGAEYDPAIPGKDALPSPADLVVCTDVLEHIETEYLGSVLRHLRSVTRVAAFLVIHTGLSNKTMADGRNAHLIIQPGEWWEQQLVAAGFTIDPTAALLAEFEALYLPPVDGEPGKHWLGVVRP